MAAPARKSRFTITLPWFPFGDAFITGLTSQHCTRRATLRENRFSGTEQLRSKDPHASAGKDRQWLEKCTRSLPGGCDPARRFEVTVSERCRFATSPVPFPQQGRATRPIVNLISCPIKDLTQCGRPDERASPLPHRTGFRTLAGFKAMGPAAGIRMNDENDIQSRSGKPRNRGRGDPAPSDIAVLAFFMIVAVACVGGYFLLMKLIDISRQEDCMLSGRRNCAPPIVVPSR